MNAATSIDVEAVANTVVGLVVRTLSGSEGLLKVLHRGGDGSIEMTAQNQLGLTDRLDFPGF